MTPHLRPDLPAVPIRACEIATASRFQGDLMEWRRLWSSLGVQFPGSRQRRRHERAASLEGSIPRKVDRDVLATGPKVLPATAAWDPNC